VHTLLQSFIQPGSCPCRPVSTPIAAVTLAHPLRRPYLCSQMLFRSPSATQHISESV
jgi:hypothetical protein